MSLHIYIAHSGEHLLADPVSFASCVGLIFPLCSPSFMRMQADAIHLQPRCLEIMDCPQYVHSAGPADLDDCPGKEREDPDACHRGISSSLGSRLDSAWIPAHSIKDRLANTDPGFSCLD